MKDKEIRRILIAYLGTHPKELCAKEIRIYQEKSIGSAICDLMAVTDKLTGYEIKSDCDDYQRLDRQIKAYDRFFDENYIVVSDRHAHSAAEHVPPHWGILRIRDDSITLERQAKRNKSVSRRAQLSVLWKLELKNLLVKNRLPLYPLKTKDFIVGAISEQVDADVLGRQIASELMQRDYSVFGAEDYTVRSEAAEALPETEIVDTLSEQDLSDYTLDQWIELYRRAKQVREVKEEAIKTLPKERAQHVIPYTDIEVSLGAPWIDKSVITDFILEVFKPRYIGFVVEHEQVTGNWLIANKNAAASSMPARLASKYGLERYNALCILEATLNLREIKLFDDKTKFNEKDTIAAIEKQRLIKQAFREWIWQDEDRRWQVEEAYNRLFEQYGAPSFDGSGLSFPEMSPECSLFPYQKDAVKRILEQPDTLLAFDVGAGKTFIMIAAAMKLRQEGLSRRNMFVVPNNIVGQWESIFVSMYPKAKVLAIEPKSFKPEIRQKTLRQIRDGDYDGVIIAYSCFEQIPLAVKTVMNEMQQRLSRLEEAVSELPNSPYGWNLSPVLNKEKEHIKKMALELVESIGHVTNNEVLFDDLEITGLFLDEAHNYKNLPIRTKMKNLSGINVKGSKKCLDMLQKIRCVQANGRGAVLATGTPLCNSISDVFTLQTYLQYEDLVRTNLDAFDNWVRTFAEPEQLFEIDVTASHYRMVRKFSRFFNLPELSRMFSQIAAFYAIDDTENLPELDGYSDTVIETYPELTGYMRELAERAEKIRSKDVHPSKDNMLKVSTDGRKAALDLKLVLRTQPEGESSKIVRCVGNAMDIYKRHPESTQLIFCDYSTPKGEAFSVYKELKERLCAEGVNPREIAFIHSYGTELRKLELYGKFNRGEVRFIIGSTFKLGIGANVQTKLKAIHHLDVPWRPADMVQREGRILRRGNENESVFIYRYIAEGSFDAYSWQILERKQRFISQFLTGSAYQRSASDLEDNVLTYAEVKALALADPIMKELAEKENELRNLRILNNEQIHSRRAREEELKDLEEKLPEIRRHVECTRANAEYSAELTEEQYKSAYESLLSSPEWERFSTIHTPEEPIDILGFTVSMPDMQDEKKPWAFLERLGSRYKLMIGDSVSGNARRVINLIKRMETLADEASEEYEKSMHRRDELKEFMNTDTSAYREKIRICEAEIERMQAEIRSSDRFAN